MKVKKILMIGTMDNIGGAASVSLTLGNILVKQGYDVKYLVGYKHSANKNVQELGLRNKYKSLVGLSNIAGFDLYYLLKYFKSFLLANDIDSGSSNEITYHPWFEEADIVHFHNIHGNFFKLNSLESITRLKKTVWTLHDLWSVTAHCGSCYDCGDWNEGKHFTPGIHHYQAMLWNNANYLWNKKRSIYSKSHLNLVTPSNWLFNKVINNSINFDSINIINNGIKLPKYNSLNKKMLRKKLNLPQNKKIVIFVANGGRNNAGKGGEYVNFIAKKYANSNIHILSIGEKAYSEANNVIGIPYLESNALYDYYRAADLFLFPSLAENFPMVILEAMSVGLPVVAFDVGGVAEEVVHKQNGYVSKYKDCSDLERGVDYIFNMTEDEYGEISKRNIDKVTNNFSAEVMTSKYIKLYENIYNEK